MRWGIGGDTVEGFEAQCIGQWKSGCRCRIKGRTPIWQGRGGRFNSEAGEDENPRLLVTTETTALFLNLTNLLGCHGKR